MTNEYYIAVGSPNEFRKKLLESSKGVLMNLKDYHNFDGIQRKKIELINILKAQVKELTFLLQKLDSILPDRDIEYEKELATKRTEHKQRTPEPAKTEPTQLDAEKLQHALANIERKLSTL